MTKNEIDILKPVVKGDAYWGSYSNVHGRLKRYAAEALRDAKLVRLVELRVDQGAHHYVAIPPTAEWDFETRSVRHNP